MTRRKLIQLPSEGPANPPAPPRWLSADLKRQWEAYWRSPAANLATRGAESIALLFRMYSRREQLQRRNQPVPRSLNREIRAWERNWGVDVRSAALLLAARDHLEAGDLAALDATLDELEHSRRAPTGQPRRPRVVRPGPSK